MENLENNDLTPAKKTKQAELTSLEAQVLSRREDLNFPALQSMFELTSIELQAILDKLPPADCTTC
jgi:hypothetical protein